MAYQNPKFGFLHAAADAGEPALTSSSSPEAATGYPLAHLVDYRPSSLFTFGQTGARYVTVDRGAGTLEEIDRVVVPAGHNLATATLIRVHTSTTGVFSGEETLRVGWNQSSEPDVSGIIDKEFTAETDDRYVRFYVLSPAGTAWSFGQLWYTATRQAATIGPKPDWTDQPVSNLIVRELPTREATSILGANRRSFSLEHLHLESTDLEVYDDLFEQCSVGGRPFYFWPPDDSEVPLLMRITDRQVTRIHDFPAPASGRFMYRVRFSMIEQTT